MAHVLIDNDKLCTCDQASRCVVMHKSGSMARCTEKEILDAGFQTVSIKHKKLGWFVFLKNIFKVTFSKEPYNIK